MRRLITGVLRRDDPQHCIRPARQRQSYYVSYPHVSPTPLNKIQSKYLGGIYGRA